jgi:UDP:flavonoid glycosyltransferase YjiC (YdhE family)
MTAARWLFYSINGKGLGHLTRLLALARQIRRRRAVDEFFFLTSCEAVSLAWQEGFASLKVPSVHSVEVAGLQARSYQQLIHTVVPSVSALYHPDVIVVDTFPAGELRELLPVLQWPVRRVFIYREQKDEVCDSPGFQNALAQYHRVLVPHDEGSATVSVPAGMAAEFVGHMLLRSRDESLPREAARRRLGLPLDRLVVYVGFGGGGDSSYANLLRWVLAQAGDFPAYHFACALPPLQPSGLDQAAPANVSFFQYWPLAECWAGFDAAISAAGYNSAGELLHHGVPTIWVPLDKFADDQRRRAARVVAAGAGWLVPPGDTGTLRAALLDLADTAKRNAISTRAQELVPRNGAEQAAVSLIQWIGAAPVPQALQG